jgi:sulfhydrogenase subunit beta (sulfur reductase)
MTLQILDKQRIPEWIESLQRKWRVVGPETGNGKTTFTEIRSADALDLTYTTTILPPKKALLPTHEPLLTLRSGRASAVDGTRPTVLIGVHTCDLHAIRLLDRVYGDGIPDQPYVRRRQRTLLIGLECLRPCSEHAFCKSMGTLAPPEGVDLHWIDLGSDYAVEVGSPEGARLLAGCRGVRPAEAADLGRLDRVMSDKWARFPYPLDFDVSRLPSLLVMGHSSELWEELAARCLSCGSCTIVCPTCSCFDVRDDMDLSLQVGERVRVWDSCQLRTFAVVAGGHNFRAARAARVRHRFLRKGRFQTEALGVVGCVGCGRCAQACIAGITPVGTYNELHRRLQQTTPAEVAE